MDMICHIFYKGANFPAHLVELHSITSSKGTERSENEGSPEPSACRVNLAHLRDDQSHLDHLDHLGKALVPNVVIQDHQGGLHSHNAYSLQCNTLAARMTCCWCKDTAEFCWRPGCFVSHQYMAPGPYLYWARDHCSAYRNHLCLKRHSFSCRKS